MNLKTILISLSALMLVACFPAKEISRDNAERVVATTNALNAVSDFALTGFRSRIDNQSLERFLVRNTATPVAGECYKEQGSYLFSLSADRSGVSMVFDQCQTESGHRLNGTVNGTVSEGDGVINVGLTGDLDIRIGSDRVSLAPMTMQLTLTVTETELSVYLSHHGTYVFDTATFRGEVKVHTELPFGCNLTQLACGGVVTYADTTGHTLRLEQDNNGVHLYLNGGFLRSYSHNDWHHLN
ncbi:hypothetical protein [Reinekea blandensis]|uniref:hypothetical protein n=1 Tax=Reinekea blandensis TaxID=374838 RepID=UPI00030D0D7C|nr:hypothetical protein [Reinekea blandensis]